jgi:hypothetical protein
MKDIAITLNTNMFARENEKWRWTKTPLEYLSQKIRHAISIFQGEWFFDISRGIPYIPDEDIQKTLHRRLVESRLQTTIMGVKGTKKLVRFETALNTQSRTLTINFAVTIDGGEIIEDSAVLEGV